MSGVFIPSIYRTAYPIDSSDQLVYRLDEATGTTTLVQDSGSALTNSAFNLTKFTGVSDLGKPGMFTNCMNVNGSTAWKSDTDLSAFTSINLATITVSCWINTRTNPGFSATAVAKAYRNDTTWTTPFAAWQLALNSAYGGNGGFGVEITRSGSIATAVATTTSDQFLSVAEWHHIGFSFDGSTAKLFKDGMQIRSVAFSGAIDYGTGGAILVGSDYAASGVSAQLDDIRIANVVRPESYFNNVYRAGVQ
jgi:hypothetical protein